MTFTGKMLNSTASLNSFSEVGSVDFIPDSDLTLVFQIFNPEAGIRYVPAAAAVVTVTFPTIDDSIDLPGAFIDQGDRSLIKVEITADQSVDLTGGNITFTIDELGDGTKISKGYIQSALRRITTGEPCC